MHVFTKENTNNLFSSNSWQIDFSSATLSVPRIKEELDAVDGRWTIHHFTATDGQKNPSQEVIVLTRSIVRASGIMCFSSANYALFFGKLCPKNPELCANYENCTIFLSKNFYFKYKIIHFQTANMGKKVLLPPNKSKQGAFFFSKL